jgi:hypothetical protein
VRRVRTKPGLTLPLIALVLAGAAWTGTNRLGERNVAGSARPAKVFALHVHARLAGKRFQALYGSTFLDGIAGGIAGLPLTTVMENDPVEWASLYGRGPTVLGFVCISDTDPNDWCYHRVFLGPTPTATFVAWLGGQTPTYWDAAVAIMTVTHEATHYQKASTDEGRVNACALQKFPGVLDRYFQIHPTVTKTVAVRKQVWRTKRVRVRRLGRWVWVVRRVRQVVVLHVQRTVPNPDYVNLVQAAQLFYASQPPPYSTGICF